MKGKAAMTTVGVVAPMDYLSVRGGSVQRIKVDLAALLDSGYQVEMIFPSRMKQPQADLPAGLTLLTYPNLQGIAFLPEKMRLLLDMHTQMLSPFFRSALRRRCSAYSIIFAHSPWSAVAAQRAAGNRVPVVYVAHNFEYGLIRQATGNPLVRRHTYNVEKRACQQATRILCVSEMDMSGLQTAYQVPAARLALLPNTVDTGFYAQTRSLYDRASQRRELGLAPSSLVLLFHGRMDYSANVDALRFILAELVPALRQAATPDVRLVIAGARIPGWCLDKQDDMVSCHSDVPDMRRFLSIADAVIVPLSMGGGTRLKILESFAAGVPVISTAKGIEGIDYRDGQHALIAERNAADFVRKISMLAGDEALRQRLTTGARDLVHQKYGLAVAARCLGEVIEQALGHTDPAGDPRQTS